MDDHAIMDLFFKRQEIALSKSEEKYGKRMHNVAYNILNSDEDAQECVNDTLLKAWNTIPPERPAFLGAFLSKITRNLAINKWKSQRAKKRGGSEVTLLLDELQDCIGTSSGPEEAYESAVVAKAINTYLNSIEQVSRVTFILRYFHGESIENISQRLQISESNVKSKLFRTRKKLSAYLEKEGIAV